MSTSRRFIDGDGVGTLEAVTMTKGSTANDRDDAGQSEALQVAKGIPVITKDSAGHSNAVPILMGSGCGVDDDQRGPAHRCGEHGGLGDTCARGKSRGRSVSRGYGGRIVLDERGLREINGGRRRQGGQTKRGWHGGSRGIEYRISVV